MSGSLLEIRGLTKAFGGLTALDDVSLAVDPGTIVALIGPNGAGKTTLFNCLTGLTPPDHGAVIFEGPSIVGLPSHVAAERGIARTFQNVRLFATLSAKDNVMVGVHCRQHTGIWDAILHTPLAVDDLLLGELVWAASKATFTAFCILLMIWVLGIAREPLSLLVLPAAFFIALVFAAMALIVNAVARSYDLLSNYFTVVVMPLVFLSGVYFPLSQLPDWLRAVAEWLPMTAAVELVRPLALGRWPEHAMRDLVLLSIWGAVCFAIALALTRRRLLK